MRILLTRSAERNAALITRLRAAGHRVDQAPLLSIRPLPVGPVDCDGAAALIFTSVNGVIHGAARIAARNLPVHAVGERTAEAARKAGWDDVHVSHGDGRALAASIVAMRPRPDGSLIHVGASEPRPGLAEGLQSAGLALRSIAVYDSNAVDRLPPDTEIALEEGDIDLVLLYSPKAAACFGALARAAAPTHILQKLAVATLSPAIAEALGGGFGTVIIASSPDEPALLAAITDRLKGFEPLEETG